MIEFKEIKDRGDLNRERILFKVLENGNVGALMLHCCATKMKEGVHRLQNLVFHTYWFVDKDVEMGDLIVVYTKDSGVNYKVKGADGERRSHFFYWGKKEAIWNDRDIAAVVGSFSNWKTSFVEDFGDDVEPI